jgi:THO complex subunit 1
LTTRDVNSKKDFDFYTEFWGLQTIFNNPSMLVNNTTNMKKLQIGLEHTLDKFKAIDEKESKASQRRGSMDTSKDKTLDPSDDGENAVTTKRKHAQIKDADSGLSTYFPKFLTSPKLLKLEV